MLAFILDINSTKLRQHNFTPMSNSKSTLVWSLRILVAVLFIVSAISKMFPLWMFEKQLVDLHITNWCWAHYLSRFLIGLELATGLALLQNNYIKTIVIPGTILLLVMFCTHLSIEMYKHGAMNGNCGCFGQMIPMTPLEAFIKNIITIGILVFIFRKVENREAGHNRIVYPFALFFASLSLMFIAFPFCKCFGEEKKPEVVSSTDHYDLRLDVPPSTLDTLQTSSTPTAVTIDTATKKINAPEKPSVKVGTTATPATTNQNQSTALNATPPAGNHSKFSGITQFGKTSVNLDQGRKIVCMFAAGCDHCRATAKAIGQIAASTPNFPPVYIIFMDEETFKIPEFFEETKVNYPYMVMDIPPFWDLMGSGASTPGVYYLQEGKIIKSYQGIEEEKFNEGEFKKIVGK